MPDWPKTLKGMSAAAKRDLNAQRKEWLETLHPIWTPSMEEAHEDIEQLLTWRGSASPECFGLRGEPFVGKTQIIQRFVDTFHCEHTDGRPFENSEPYGDDFPPVPVVWLPTEKTSKQLLESFLSFYGIETKTNKNVGLLTRDVQKQVRMHKTQLVVLDDVHNLRGSNAAIDLKVMYEKLGSVMFLFTRTNDKCPAFDVKTGGNQTLDRTRWQVIEAPEITSPEWIELLAAFEGAMPWCHRGDEPLLLPHAELLHERTGGKTGRLAFLMRHMTAAMIRHNKNGEDKVTADLIKSIKMPNYDTTYLAA